MIVISANYNRCLLSDPLDNFVRTWPVVDKIADAPQLVKIALRQCIQSREVAMNIGDDDDLQRPSVRAQKTSVHAAISNSESRGASAGTGKPRRDLARGHHLPIRVD
jgi:hypothetical protein